MALRRLIENMATIQDQFFHQGSFISKINTRRHQRNERRALVDDTGDGDSFHGVLLSGVEPPVLPQDLPPETLLLADMTGHHSSSSSGSIVTLLLLGFLRSFAVMFGRIKSVEWR